MTKIPQIKGGNGKIEGIRKQMHVVEISQIKMILPKASLKWDIKFGGMPKLLGNTEKMWHARVNHI